jgi:PAS domain S-box-containing protein
MNVVSGNLTERSTSRQAILVVEDSASVAARLQKTLIRLGYAVLAVVAAGEEAIQQAIEAHPDLILMDIHPAGNLDGIETAGQICAQLDLPVIYLTDRADDPLLQQARLSEPHHYLLKPIRDEELYATIEVALCRHRLETRNKQVEKELARYRDHLEDLVQERNAELTETVTTIQRRNEQLQREIAEHKETEKALRDSEARYRKKAEQVLEESELMFKLMIDQIPYVIEFFRPDGLTFMVNRQWEETYQTDKAQVIGKFNLLQDPQIKELGVLPLLEKAFKGELVTMPDSEFDPAASNYPGRKRWLRTKVIPIKDDVGEVKFVAIMHEDITERKNAEDALRESEERYRQLVELVPDLIVVHHEGKVQFVNKAGVKLLGASSPDQIIGKPITEFMSPAYQDVSKQRIQQLLAEGKRLPLLEQKLLCLDGRELDIEVVGVPFSHQGGTAVQIIAHDITKRKQAEKALHSYTERLEGLQQVGLELAAQLDLDSLLHSIVSRAVELGGGSAGGLYLHRPEREELELVVVVGADPTFVGTILHPGEGLSGKVWKTDEPLAVADYRNWSGRSPLFDELPLQAVLGVPIRWGQQRLGVLFVWTGKPHVFSPSDTQLLSILATHAAVAIENARLFKAEREQRQLAETLREVSGVLNTSLDRGQVLDLILEQLAHVIEYDNASVMLLAGDTLEIAAQRGFLPTDPKMVPIQVARFAHLRDVLQERRPGIIPNTTTDPRWQHRQVSSNIHSWLGVPLAIQDRAIGVLNLGKKERDFYTQRDAEVVMAIANQAAIAIENADLYDRTRHRSRELALLNQVIAASATGRQIEPILETACRELALTFDLPRAATAFFNEEKTELAVVAEYSSARPESGESCSGLGKVLPVMQTPSAQYILEHKRPFVENARLDPSPQSLVSSMTAPGHDLMCEGSIISLLALPIIVEEKVVGMMEVGATEPHRFTADEVSLAQRVAEQVAGALTRVHLEETQQRLSTAVEQAAEAVIITDPNGGILYVNPAFEQITGHSREQAIGLGPTTAPTREAAARFYREMWQAIGTSHVWQERLTDHKPDGSVYTVDTIISPVRTPAGEIANYVATMRDVTRELQLEEQFHQAQKMEAMGRLAGGIAHDFNNLLTVIHLSTRLLERQLHAQDPLWELVQQIREAGQRATKLTGQLLSFSRREIVEPRLLNINNVTDEMSRMLQRLIREDVELQTALAKDLWLVKMDPMQVDQVLINLALNASDAMPDGGTLTIETANVILDEVYAASHVDTQPGEYVQLTLSDTGAGMSDEVQAHLFEPFFTTKELGKGTGLGLAIVYGIVKQNGGHIWVCSELGRGTTFKIYLPRAKEGQVSARAHRPVATRGMRGTETILLVEDDAAVRNLAIQILQVHGYRVLAAQDGMEALQVSQEHEEPIHLLLTDLVMPQIGGRELARRLRAQRSEMQVLFMSGYANEVIVHNDLVEEGAAFLPKPLTVESLTQKVRTVLDRSA